jgi:UDP-glucose 4-epimerase
MKMLVVGSGGFIGTHLAAWIAQRHEVHTCDVSGSASETHHVIDPDEARFGVILQRVKPDVCINCAGAADVSLSFQRPELDFKLNVELVQKLLEAIRDRSPSTRLVNLSSAAVYGNPTSIPVLEEAPVAPISPYGWHKFAAETLCREYAQSFGVGTMSLRLFSVFGPGLKKQLYWDVYQKSVESGEVVCAGTGEETRDYIFVKDVITAIEAVIDRAQFTGGALNVASGRSVSIREAVETLFQALDWGGKLVFNGVGRGGDPLHWRADIGRLKALGYAPKYDYQSGMRELAQWLKVSR